MRSCHAQDARTSRHLEHARQAAWLTALKVHSQLGNFLKLIALKTMKSGTDQTNNDKKYLYRLDEVMIDCNDEVINRRRNKTNDEYTTIYWKQVHKANNFDTPIYQQARDYVGFKSDQKTYWMPLLGGPPSSKLRKSSKIYELVKDLSDEHLQGDLSGFDSQ